MHAVFWVGAQDAGEATRRHPPEIGDFRGWAGAKPGGLQEIGLDITGGGITGKVSKVIDDNELEVEIAEGVKIRAQRCTFNQETIALKLLEIIGQDVNVYIRASKSDGYPEAVVAPRNAAIDVTPPPNFNVTDAFKGSVDDLNVPTICHWLEKPLP